MKTIDVKKGFFNYKVVKRAQCKKGGVRHVKKEQVEKIYNDLVDSFNEPATGLIKRSENYRLVAAGSLTLIRQILQLGLED